MVKVIGKDWTHVALSKDELAYIQKGRNLVQELTEKAMRENPWHKLVRSQVVREGDRHMLYMRFEPDPEALTHSQRTTRKESMTQPKQYAMGAILYAHEEAKANLEDMLEYEILENMIYLAVAQDALCTYGRKFGVEPYYVAWQEADNNIVISDTPMKYENNKRWYPMTADGGIEVLVNHKPKFAGFDRYGDTQVLVKGVLDWRNSDKYEHFVLEGK